MNNRKQKRKKNFQLQKKIYGSIVYILTYVDL